MSVPAEAYAFGFNYIYIVIAMVVVVPILCYIITPVFYENNISNCYEVFGFLKSLKQKVSIFNVLPL